MSTLYVFRIIATFAVGIPFVRYVLRFAFKELPEDADWMDRDTRNKARMISILCPTMFLGMFISACLHVDNYYFGDEFIVSIIVLVLTVIFNIIHWCVNKKKIKTKLYPLIKLFQVVLPTVYMVIAMFVIKINK